MRLVDERYAIAFQSNRIYVLYLLVDKENLLGFNLMKDLSEDLRYENITETRGWLCLCLINHYLKYPKTYRTPKEHSSIEAESFGQGNLNIFEYENWCILRKGSNSTFP